jgi:prepilin-type processing-associated H-X9-DG protein
MVMDNGNPNAHSVSYPFDGSLYQLRTNHGGFGNVVYADTHVESVSDREVRARNTLILRDGFSWNKKN